VASNLFSQEEDCNRDVDHAGSILGHVRINLLRPRCNSSPHTLDALKALPAQKFNLHSRGLIHEGMAADIVIFDEKKVNDAATFTMPHAYSKGFNYVIVNGEVVVDDNKFTGTRSGAVLKGPGLTQ